MPDIHYRGPESVSKYYSDSSRSFFVVFDKNSTINNVKTKDSACIFHSYVDRHKKKTISVYSIPVEPEIQHSSLALGKNIMEHGDFSEPCSEQVKSKMTEIFSSVPNKEDFLSDNWMFPAGWGVDILSRKPYTVFEQLYMKDSSNQSNPVLHIDTQTKLCCRYLKRFPMDSDYLLSFDSLSEPGTIFAITVFRFKEKERVYPNVDSGVYFQTDKEWNKHCLIIPKMNGMTSFYVTLNFICGNAFFDNFELRPIL